MAYMKDSAGRRLDSFKAISRTEADTLLGGKFDVPVAQHTIVIGDSVDQDPAGWFDTSAALSGGRIRRRANAGVGGETTTSILARLDAVITQGPKVIIGVGGTNDVGNGVPEATTRANVASFVARTRAANITPVLRAIPPSNVAATSVWTTVALHRAQIARHNNWLRNYAAANGVPFIDIYTPLVDQATGGYITGYTTDGTHPNATGNIVCGRYVATHLPPIFEYAARQPLPLLNGIDNLVPGALFIGDANSDGLADNWSGGGGFGTKSIDASDSGIRGNWQNLAGTGLATIYRDITGMIPGRTIEAAAIGAITSGTMTIRLQFFTPAFVAVGGFTYLVQSSGVPFTKADRATFQARAVVPATADRIKIEVVSNNGASSLAVAQFGLWDLTDLGLAA